MKKLLAALAMAICATASHAAVLIYTWEDNGNIVSSWSGTLDLTGLAPRPHTNQPTDTFALQPSRAYFFSLPGAYDAWDGVAFSQRTFGTSTGYYTNGAFTGTGFGYLTDRTRIYLPDSFQSGDTLEGESTFFNTSFLAQGITAPLTLTLTLPNDTITHVFGQTAPVPLPAGLPLMLAGLGAFAFLRRRHGRV